MLRSNVGKTARSPSLTSQESFSAVMITDMVADVNVKPEDEVVKKSTKERSNLAFEGDGEVKGLSLENIGSTKINGNTISKGVILNAVQFTSSDMKTALDEKPMQLTASLAVPSIIQKEPQPKGFKDMSITRKIAFCFSFLPSIFFVLCFAVILPCKVPRQCVEEAWIVTFNDTEPFSRLELTDKIVLTAFKEGGNVVLELGINDGKWTEIELPSSPAYFKCGKIIYDNQTNCMVMDESGKVYTFNDTHCDNLWNPVPETEILPPSPVILADCSDKLEDIGVAVSNTNFKILHGGNKVSNFPVTHCDSVPVKLMSWKKGNSSDIVFVCNKDGEDRLVKVPRNAWCALTQNSSEIPLVLDTGALDSLKESVIKPLEDNDLLIWSGNEVSMIQPNGTLSWKVFNVSHPEENRFILHGKFLGENKQLVFIGSNRASGLQVTLLNPSDGSLVKKLNFDYIEALEAIPIKGQKRDFALLLLRKTALDIMTAAFSRISDISSTIVSILSNEKMNDSTSSPATEELAILDLEGNLDTITELRDVEDSTFKTTITATTDEHGILCVYLLSMLDNVQMKTTEVKNINVANWDKSNKSKCLAK